ncbi:MAG: hypothetical protein KBB14_01750 [Thermoanaerobaculia bacterium]|jgi:hypothetical protein|nr:hypothetical protein [Thermoanaerobaculia bacterium]
MGRIVQSVAMSYVRGCLVGGVVTIYVFAIFIGFFLLPLGRMHRTPGSDPKEIFLPIGIGAFFLMVLPAILAYFGARARNTAFDRMFGSLGLAGFPYAVQYRRYEGTYGGRRFQGFFSRGPRFALEADVAVRTRFGITAGSGDTRLLAALAGKPPIRFAVPAFEGLDVFGEEEAWVRRVLSEPGVPALLGRLLRFQGPFARRQLVLRPGALNVTFHLSTAFMNWIPSTAQIRDWADALVTLAEIVERVPPPEVAIAPTRLEQQVDSVRRMGFAVNPGALALGAMLVTTLAIAAIAGIIVAAQKSCRPSRGPGSVAEAREVLHHVYATAQNLQVAELPAASMLDLFGIRGHLGAVEAEDDKDLRAVAKVPKGARIVVAKSPGTGAAREVEWLFDPPLSANVSVVEQQLGKLELSPAPGEPTAVLGLATPRKADGARWPVRVRVRFEGKAGGPITRIAAYRDGPAAPAQAPSTGEAAGPSASTPSAAPGPAAAPPAPATSGMLPMCPSLFLNVGEMAIGESRSCVCTRDTGIGIRGNGRYDPSSSLCEAARHAGALTRPGDVVTFWRQPDCPRLWGSAANGVVSGNFASPTATFSFTAEPPPCPPPSSTAADLAPCPGLFSKELEAMPDGSSFDCTCTYDKYGKGSLWGTRVYFLGSNVCDAAQHAGVVDRKGSAVTVFLGGPCDRFRGTRSYGKVSESRRKPGRSMAFQQPYPDCPGPTDPW